MAKKIGCNLTVINPFAKAPRHSPEATTSPEDIKEMKSKKYDSPSTSYSSGEEESSTDTDEEQENNYSNGRRTRRRRGKKSVVNNEAPKP